jgi:uncharacterized protein YutE (UPF0331/DUF86 family)
MTPGHPDAAVVRRHLFAIDAALQQLRQHQGRPAAELSRDPDRLWAVERGLQLCAQNALDVSTHLAAASGRDVADYASAIDTLASLGILPEDFTRRFRGIAGFRNVIVHGYLELDLSIVHGLLESGLDDFVTFARHVNAYLDTLS